MTRRGSLTDLTGSHRGDFRSVRVSKPRGRGGAHSKLQDKIDVMRSDTTDGVTARYDTFELLPLLLLEYSLDFWLDALEQVLPGILGLPPQRP